MLDDITLFTIIFYVSLSLPIFVLFLLSKYYSLEKENLFLNYLAPAYLIFIFLLIALRPIGYSGFTDTQMYIDWFNKSKTDNVIHKKDIGFGLLTFIASKILTIRLFFVLCTAISFGTLFWISKKISNRYWFLFFLGTAVSLYFWNHQVFTIRQMIASLFFITAFFLKKGLYKILWLLLAVSFHKTFLLPLFCYLVIVFYNKTNFYLALWLISIPFSYFFGNEIWEFILKLVPPILRNYYFPMADTISLSNFRWDVVFYSSIFVILPFCYKCSDEKYKFFLNLYLLTNIFTILLIWPTGGFIHRFAYLSWFLSPLLVYYPLFRNNKEFSYKPFFKTITVFYLLVLFYVGFKIWKQDYKFVPDKSVITANI